MARRTGARTGRGTGRRDGQTGRRVGELTDGPTSESADGRNSAQVNVPTSKPEDGRTGEQVSKPTRRMDSRTGRRAGERADEPACLREASLSYLTRVTTEARSETTTEWIRSHVGRRQRYRPTPKGGKLRKALARTRKELTGCFYQLLSGHAAVAEHLVRVGQAQSDRCWWCGSGERQTRFHLLIRCRRWELEIKR